MMNNDIVQEYHRHRYPYLLIDCVDEINPGKSVKGHKNFSQDEWLFNCNAKSGQPVPFSMLIEILTEMFLMPVLAMEGCKGKITNFLSADEAKAYCDVFPGDRMDVEASIDSFRRGIASGHAAGYVDGKMVCSAKLKFVIPDIMDQYKPAADRGPQ